MKKRIWEVDALRGFCVLCMIFVHLCFDLQTFGLISLRQGWLHNFFYKGWGGAFFFAISGVSATLGSRSVKRGFLVLCAALLVSGVTVGMDLLGITRGMSVYFGALHCLGVCMLLWPLFGKLPERLLKRNWHTALLFVIGVCLVALGLYFRSLPRLSHNFLMALGRPGPRGSGDYFPLLPNFGYFLVGAGLGRLLYPTKESLMPKVSAENPVIRFFTFFGIHALPVYLLHQPLLYGLAALLAALVQ